MNPLDELELEVRQLPGVGFVGAIETAGGAVIQLGVHAGFDQAAIVLQARRLAELHLAGSVRIELTLLGGQETDPSRAAMTSGGGRGRVQLLVVLPSPEREEVEIHLAHGGRRTIGRAGIGGLDLVARATIEALEALGKRAPFEVRAAVRLEDFSRPELMTETADVVGVALVSTEPDHPRPRFGASAGRTPEEATARATLHALNRYLEPIS